LAPPAGFVVAASSILPELLRPKQLRFSGGTAQVGPYNFPKQKLGAATLSSVGRLQTGGTADKRADTCPLLIS